MVCSELGDFVGGFTNVRIVDGQIVPLNCFISEIVQISFEKCADF